MAGATDSARLVQRLMRKGESKGVDAFVIAVGRRHAKA
jgi:hypothetical protein